MRDYQDKTDERVRPLPSDRPVAGMPVTGADQGRGRAAAGPTTDRENEADAARTDMPGAAGERPPADSPGAAVAADDPGPARVADRSDTAVLADESGADAAADGTGVPGSGLGTAADGTGIAGSGRGALAGEDAAERLIGRNDADRFETRWREVKTGFVDDPRESVERASALCEEAVTALTNALEQRRGSLREQWNGDADTERLRTALRAYGVLLERLSSV